MEYFRDLPPLTRVIVTDSPEIQFRQLLRILFTRYGRSTGFRFESADRDGVGFDGIVKQDYPGLEWPVIFHMKWVNGPINKEPTASEIKTSFTLAIESHIPFKSFILVTPHDLSETEKVWLGGFQRDHNIKTYYIGHKKIIELMRCCPALRKYYYGGDWEGAEHFETIGARYIESVVNELRYLEFIGLPTWQYKRQDLLKSTELKKVYIPLLFQKDRRSTVLLTLPGVIKISARNIILGDPGTGKSTLAKYLALVYAAEIPLTNELKVVKKTPFIIPIRDFVRVKKGKPNTFDFIDYLKYTAEKNYDMTDIDKDFFIALLELGKAIVIFDGLDEVTSKQNQDEIVKEIKKFACFYPDTPVWITSRILGYGNDVQFDPGEYTHYYIATLSVEQAFDFIERWYRVQIPVKQDEREFRINSLKKAIEENEGVKRLQKNPLLLTMMALVHQFEGTLPDDRGKLYEKCLELLLKTWQDQKYISQGVKSPLEKIGIRYDDQLRLLAAAAFYIQEKNQDAPNDFARGVIGEKELEDILFKTRFDPRRIREDKAREDIKTFLSYIRDRVGLFVEAGKSDDGNENLLSFIHLSFLEYLCAYQIAQDKTKSQTEHIDTLLNYMGKPSWEEVLLIALYIFSKSPSGDIFLDSFVNRVFSQLQTGPEPYHWYLLGRAVRDNISFTFEDIYKIIKGLLELWLNDNTNQVPRIIIDEIVDFSTAGRAFLEEILKESTRKDPAPKAFASLHFFTQFFLVNSEIIDAVKSNSDSPNLLAYLPVFRNDRVLSRFVDQNLEVYQWHIYYNSVKDNTCENLDRIINYNINERELKGYIISSWTKLFIAIRDRKYFLEKNQVAANSELQLETIDFDFGYAELKYPLNLFRPYIETTPGYPDIPGNVEISRITDEIFRFLEKSGNPTLNQTYVTSWINGIMEKSLSSLSEKLSSRYKLLPEESNQIKEISLNYSSAFGKYLSYDLNKYLNVVFSEDLMHVLTDTYQQDFTRYLSRDFSQYLSQDYKRNSNWYLSKGFSRFIERDFGLVLSRKFIRYFFGYFTRGICRDFVHNCRQKFNPEFRAMISVTCSKLYNIEINWADFNQLKDEVLYDCFSNLFMENNEAFIDYFFNYLYDYLFFRKMKILFGEFTVSQSIPSPGKVTLPGHIKIKLNENFMVPFMFDFILTGAFNHYIIKILADLNNKFYKNKKPGGKMIGEAVEDFCRDHSFLSYIIREMWFIYSREFNEKSQAAHGLNNLRLASFLTDAANVSLVSDMSCAGNEWDKILTAAEASKDPFVQLALTLYKISIFEDNRKNAIRLYEQMRDFKDKYPQYYKLIL